MSVWNDKSSLKKNKDMQICHECIVYFWTSPTLLGIPGKPIYKKLKRKRKSYLGWINKY